MLESSWDTWVSLHENESMPPLRYRVFPDHDALKEISVLFQSAATEVFPEAGLTEKEIIRAFQDAYHIERILSDPSRAKRAFFRFVETIAGRKGQLTALQPPLVLPQDIYLNLEHDCWVNPWQTQRTSNASVPELLEKSIERAALYISFAERYWAGEETLDEIKRRLGNLGYDTGLPCTTE